MANLKLTKNVPVNLLDFLGVPVGTIVEVVSINGHEIRVYDTASSPAIDEDDFLPVTFGSSKVITDASDLGVWGVCLSDDGMLDVRLSV